MSYLLNLAIAADQALNALLAGNPDETLSSRAYRAKRDGHRYWGWTAKAIDTLFFWQPGHCRLAYEFEVARGRLFIYMNTGD